jgi:DNA-directed RNA polymerase specialized sigma24 family protein
MKKKLPKKLNGINEEEFLRVVDNITSKLAYKFRFGYHNFEDMKQQATIFAIEALDKYDKSRPLENFLWTHIRNRLFNFKRDNYQRPDKPCLTCPFYDANKQASFSQCTKYNDKQNCELYSAWFTRNNAKKNIMDTVNIEDTPLHASSSNNIEDNISDKEIIKLLDEKIPFQHREIYLKVKNGSKISKKDQRILYEIISSLLENKDE